ncbi:hypothetical protein AN958_12219, partial [Leucoagaricus sp. SymC.cos]
RTVVCLSVFLQTTSQKCNYLQSILRIFFHSALVPEKVIETLAHAGLSMSLSSINSAVELLLGKAAEKLCESAHTLKTVFAYNNFNMSFHITELTVL